MAGRAWPNLGRRAANILALTSFALLLLVGVLATGMALRVNRAADWVAHSLEAQARAAGLLSEVQDVELGRRGYLLTRSDAYLAPYKSPRRDSTGAGRFAIACRRQSRANSAGGAHGRAD